MGASNTSTLDTIDGYPIRLTPEQSLNILGLAYAKSTLTWRDVKRHPHITFAFCVKEGVPPRKLHALQPDITEWIKSGKIFLSDCVNMAEWSPNPFQHFGCKLGDLLMHRKYLPAEVLIRAGVTVDILCDRYGLGGDHMAVLGYSAEDWVKLGIKEKHLDLLTQAQWDCVFGKLRREDIIVPRGH